MGSNPTKTNIDHYKLTSSLLTIIIISILCVFVYFQTARAALHPEKPKLTTENFELGEKLYQNRCAVCHGVTGAGDGAASYLLNPKPRDFTRNEFRLISTTSMEATDEDLYQVITRGMAGSAMPAWDHLSEDERWALVYYIRYLTELPNHVTPGDSEDENLGKKLSWKTKEKMIQKEIDPESLIRVPSAPEVTSAGLTRGRELFVKACASCHGATGKGDGLQIMQDSQGRPVKPRDLTAGIYKGSSSSEDLYYRMVAGLPGSPMPGYAEAFNQEQIWDLIHYVQTLSEPEKDHHALLHFGKVKATHSKDELLLNPLADQWMNVKPTTLSVVPLWWRDERVHGVELRVLYNGENIGFHLSWEDATRDDSQVAPQNFSDGVAVQLSTAKEPPLFSMGSTEAPVVLWFWKAAWQEDVKYWRDIETEYPDVAIDLYESQTNYHYGELFNPKNAKAQYQDPRYMTAWGAGNPISNPDRIASSETGMAKGFSSFTSQPFELEKTQTQGIWKNGKWQVVFIRPLRPGNDGIEIKPGETVHTAYAVWDGSHKDRNGQKMVSYWTELVLEK